MCKVALLVPLREEFETKTFEEQMWFSLLKTLALNENRVSDETRPKVFRFPGPIYDQQDHCPLD